LYLAHSTQPSAFGAAASFAALLLWLYYTSLIFLFGAEFTACLGELREETEGRSSSQKLAVPNNRANAIMPHAPTTRLAVGKWRKSI
jgi:membrane protein